MRLENWYVTNDFLNPYVAPELKPCYLIGNVYGHPRFEDGRQVITSRIMEIKDKGDHKEAVTKSGSIYELYKEDVDSYAEKIYPGYYERIGEKQDG